ncbi:MAG: hemerythrin family protein [Lachnospiraceae bacterium]|nr:hemerythrin family protein [Lachnospiraceae bacterium]
MYEMKPEYYTGIELIDREHKRLFEIAESAYQLLKNDFMPDKFDAIHAILQELIDYTKVHFADEEKYMEEMKYRRIFSQKVMHKEFIDKLDAIDMDEVDKNPEKATEDITRFLTDWLVEHILHMDKQIAEA